MILNLRQIYQVVGECELIDYQIEQSELDGYKGIALSTPITVKGKIENRASIVTLNLEVDVKMLHNCDRCLIQFEREYCYKFRHIVVRTLNNESDEYVVTNGNKLDLNELVMSDLILSIPTKKLCDENCKGLCPKCGTDLNKSECSC